MILSPPTRWVYPIAHPGSVVFSGGFPECAGTCLARLPSHQSTVALAGGMVITIFRAVALPRCRRLLVVRPWRPTSNRSVARRYGHPSRATRRGAPSVLQWPLEASAALALEIPHAGSWQSRGLRAAHVSAALPDSPRAWRTRGSGQGVEGLCRLPGVDAGLSRGARRRPGRSAGETHAESRRRRGAVLSREARPELRVAPARDHRSKDRLER